MLLRRLVADGLSGGSLEFEPEGRVVRLPAAELVAEAAALWSAALDRSQLTAMAQRLGWSGPATVVGGDPADPALDGLRPSGVDRTVLPGGRTVTIELHFGLDPTLFSRFREAASREPRLASVLANDPSLVVKVGWFLSLDRTWGAPSLLAIRLGEVPFETTGKDRPSFLAQLLPELGRRVQVTDPFAGPDELATRLLRAQGSSEPRLRDGVAAVRRAASSPPFELPSLELVDADGEVTLCFGPELRSFRRLGPAAVRQVAWLAAAHLGAADLLVIPEPVSDEVVEYFEAALEASGAPVEQVVFA